MDPIWIVRVRCPGCQETVEVIVPIRAMPCSCGHVLTREEWKRLEPTAEPVELGR